MKKICLRCQREYAADGVSFCFDDGEPLHPALTSDSRICPKCETRYGTGAVKCARDQAPVVKPGDIAFARQRVCAQCGRVATDGSAEFCGHDGARVVARWEVGLVARTAVPGELQAHADAPIAEVPPARFSPDRSDLSTAKGPKKVAPKATESGPALSAPKHAVSFPAVKEPAAAPAMAGKAAPAPAPAPASPSVSTGGTGWYMAGGDVAGASGVGLAGERPPSRSSAARRTDDLDEAFGPTRVSRKLIAGTLISALLCGGAFAYSRYAASHRAQTSAAPATRAADVAATAPIAIAAPAPTPPPAPAPAPAPILPPTPAPSPTAAVPRPPAPVAPPPPVVTAPVPTPAPQLAAREDGRRRKPRGKARARPDDDPTSALEAAMRRAASTTPTRESTAPAPAPVARPVAPPAEKPAPKKRLSRAEAERYFLDAAAEYKGARPQEALRRFRIIAQLGPKDADLQGRVLLNLGHITEGLGNCPGAKKYYQRAAKLVAPDARLRPDLEARLLRTKEACP